MYRKSHFTPAESWWVIDYPWLKLRPFFTSSAHSLTAGDPCVVKTANPARLEVIDSHRKIDGGNKQGVYHKINYFARVWHQDYKFCFFFIMKKNIPGFSDFLVFLQRSCSYTKTKRTKKKETFDQLHLWLYCMYCKPVHDSFYVIKTWVV